MEGFEELIGFNKRYPYSKDVYRQMQHWFITNNPDDGMFFPSSELHELKPNITTQFIQSNLARNQDREVLNTEFNSYCWSLHTFGAWRNTLGIYRIDPDIFEQVTTSPIPADTPTTIFTRLPEWCVYLDIPHKLMHVHDDGTRSMMSGFWALFDTVEMAGKTMRTLNILFNVSNRENSPFNKIQPVKIIIEEGMTVETSVLAMYTKYKTLDSMNDEDKKESLKNDIEGATTLLSLLLWLCAEEPDISNINGEPVTPEQMRLPKYSRNKKTGVFVPPSHPTIYEIGKRLGGEVRQFNKEHGHSDSRASSRKRPHIRRGHWHGVWKGVGQDKQFSIYWQPAIFVNTTL